MEGVHRSDPERSLRLTEEDFYELTDSGTLLCPESQSLDFTRFNIMMLKRLRAYLQRKSAEVVLHMTNPAEMEALLLSSKYLMVETSIISNLVQASAAAAFDHREQFGQLNEQTKSQAEFSAEFSAPLGREKWHYDMRQMRKELSNVQEDAARSLCPSPPVTCTPAISASPPSPDRSQHLLHPDDTPFPRMVSPPPSKPLSSDEPSEKVLDSARSVNGVSSTQIRLERSRTVKYFGSRPNSASQPPQPLPQIPQIRTRKFATSGNAHWQLTQPLPRIPQIPQRRSKTLHAAPDVTVVTANGRDFVPKHVLDNRIMLDH